MFETIKRWNEERKLSSHERFILKAGRRIVENRKRELEGKPLKGMVVTSAESPRYFGSDRWLPGFPPEPSAILVPSAEFQGIDYGELTTEDERELIEQVESPPTRSTLGDTPRDRD